MKFSIASVLFLAIALCSCVIASPVASHYGLDNSKVPVLDVHTLQERSTMYPVKSNDALIAKIMANLKANLHANVFASISANVSDMSYSYCIDFNPCRSLVLRKGCCFTQDPCQYSSWSHQG